MKVFLQWVLWLIGIWAYLEWVDIGRAGAISFLSAVLPFLEPKTVSGSWVLGGIFLVAWAMIRVYDSLLLRLQGAQASLPLPDMGRIARAIRGRGLTRGGKNGQGHAYDGMIDDWCRKAERSKKWNAIPIGYGPIQAGTYRGSAKK